MKPGTKLLTLLLVASALLAGCNSGGSGPADDVPYRTKLYLDHEEGLLPEPMSGYVTTTHYMSAGTVTEEWRVEIGEETLADEFAYSLVIASAGTTNVDLAVVLENDGDEVVIAEAAFVIDSDRYLPYRGTFTPTDAAGAEGQTLILRMEASGSDYGMQFGGLGTNLSVFEAPELAGEIKEQRSAALTWVLDNISITGDVELIDTPLFTNTVDQLDFTIMKGDNASWLIGWGLTQSELPYRLTWEDNAFAAEELTVDEAGDLGLEEMQISFEIE